jgi:hypothetical protein
MLSDTEIGESQKNVFPYISNGIYFQHVWYLLVAEIYHLVEVHCEVEMNHLLISPLSIHQFSSHF